MASRPERVAPPEIFYDDTEARKYTSSSRIIDIQASLSERALELLALPEDGVPKLLLDIGCGSGLSGETLSEEGHHWIGLDISPSMLSMFSFSPTVRSLRPFLDKHNLIFSLWHKSLYIALEREVEGDLLLSDMGQGLGLRPGVIDGAISISAVQWLCNADRSSHNPRLRLKAFFTSLYRCLANGAKAVFQVYPENVDQRELILNAAMHAGFSGGIVVDFPHSSKKRKEFLVLGCGQLSTKASLSKGKIEDEEKLSDEESEDEENQTVRLSDRHRPVKKQRKNNKSGKGKEWILRKKDQMRRRGNDVPLDTKYTGRKRKGRF
ncbi:18S rRNA (guanine-N(7))-methyltransferase RID2 isoform X1 [Medicago truncatula]|uniref:18S rRNA (guanine-N(7))-methyltransferase RID2 isoform X1 n=1 Tax=Medicago truncatula TaxID=3880 RepID=UPI001968A202|nr:18S rRNA (guanine-N(7))-methyltransferase RID2 isoform X1 [Medicago truncatula]